MSLIKKIFFLSLFLFFLSGLFWAVYMLSFRESPPEKISEEQKKEELKENAYATIPITDEKIFVLSQETVTSPILSPNGKSIRFYSKFDGLAKEFDFYGKNQVNLSARNNFGLVNVSWSPEKNQAVLKTVDNQSQAVFYFHNLKSDLLVPFKGGADEIVWQTNADRVLYKYYDAENMVRSLNVSDPDGTNWRKIADLKHRKISLAQAGKTGLVSFWSYPDAYFPTVLETAPLSGNDSREIFEGRYGADYLWNYSGSQILVSHADAKGGSQTQLAILNDSGGEYKNLGIPTFVSKCAWSRDDKTIYCALPGGIPDYSVLPNDYQEKKFFTTDTFWKINTQNGEKSRLVETEKINASYDAQNLFLDESESLLFFLNRADGKIYKIIL